MLNNHAQLLAVTCPKFLDLVAAFLAAQLVVELLLQLDGDVAKQFRLTACGVVVVLRIPQAFLPLEGIQNETQNLVVQR